MTATASIPKVSPSTRRRKPLPPLSVWIRLKRTGGCLLSTQSNDFFCADDISDELLASSDIIFLTGICQLKGSDGEQLTSFAKKGHDMGKFVAMDVLWDLDGQWLPKFKEALPYVDLFMPSFDEVEQMIHKSDPYEMVKVLRSFGPQNVIIKLGRHGIIAMEGDQEPYRMSAWDVDALSQSHRRWRRFLRRYPHRPCQGDEPFGRRQPGTSRLRLLHSGLRHLRRGEIPGSDLLRYEFRQYETL